MIILSSRRKIQIAQGIHRVTTLFRGKILGKPSQGEFTRQGLRWQLDLNEGIDFAIWLTGAFERRLQLVYTRHIKPGMTVLDLGANIGAHTLPLARLVGPKGKVIAVEATKFAIEKLQRNLALNPGLETPVELVHALLGANGARSAPSHLYSSWPLTGGSDLHPELRGALKPIGGAACTTVDSLVERNSHVKVDWIKLDVDGHELEVLQGAQTTLTRHRPKILIEFAPYCHSERPGNFTELVALLLDSHYDLSVAESGRRLPPNPEKIEGMITPGGSINVLASPRSP